MHVYNVSRASNKREAGWLSDGLEFVTEMKLNFINLKRRPGWKRWLQSFIGIIVCYCLLIHFYAQFPLVQIPIAFHFSVQPQSQYNLKVRDNVCYRSSRDAYDPSSHKILHS